MAEGLIARAGRWCYRRRWRVVALWAAAVVLGVIGAGQVFGSLASSNAPTSMESFQGQSVLAAHASQGGTVVAVIDGIDPSDATVRTDVKALAVSLAQVPGVQKVVTPFDAGLPADQAGVLLAKDRHGLLVQVVLAKLSDGAQDTTATALTKALHAFTMDGQKTARVRVGGGPVLDQQANAQAETDLSRAETMSLPLTLVVLVFIFGGIIAAGMPVLAAIVSIAFSMAVLYLFTRVTSIDSNAVTVVTLLGLGLSIDYGLLLVARYREELAGGFDPETALGRAWATAGRTILFSALTVAAALSGLLMFGITAFTALGAAGISVALAAMLVALTFTAALLGIARNRIRPSKRAGRRRDAETGFFAGLARLVQRRPLLTAFAGGAALVAVAMPALGMTMSLNDLDTVPTSIESSQVAHVLSDDYGQSASPAITVVAHASPAGLDTWAAHWRGADGVRRVYPAEQAGDGLATVNLDTTGDPEGSAARALVDRIRADRPAGGQSWVTGDAAFIDDVLGQISDRLPLAIAVTLIAMTVLLFAMTGSVVVPLKAIVMNAVSLGATFGVMTAVFQHGFLAGTLGTLTVPGLSPFTVVSVFAFAFGLSMDYEVFLLGRIKEYVDRGYPTDVAVRRGLQHSGRIITSAALLMVIVFACFVTGKMGGVQQVGLGLAVAVAIDATLVRCVLVPATMTILGDANWWAPRWLKSVHRRTVLPETVLPESVLPETVLPQAVLPAIPVAPEPALPRAFVAPEPVRDGVVSEPVAQPEPAEVRRRKSLALGYTCWLFLGLFGVHHFYLGRNRLGMLYLCTVGLAGIGWLVDPFLLPRQVRAVNAERDARTAADEPQDTRDLVMS